MAAHTLPMGVFGIISGWRICFGVFRIRLTNPTFCCTVWGARPWTPKYAHARPLGGRAHRASISVGACTPGVHWRGGACTPGVHWRGGVHSGRPLAWGRALRTGRPSACMGIHWRALLTVQQNVGLVQMIHLYY